MAKATTNGGPTLDLNAADNNEEDTHADTDHPKGDLAQPSDSVHEAAGDEPHTSTEENDTMNASPKQRVFSFDTATFTIPVPDTTVIPTRSTALPFKAWFTKFEPDAHEGKAPHLFLPDAYWIVERKVDPAKLEKGSYQKQKVREQFNQWRKDVGKKGEGLLLVTMRRTGNEREWEEPGLSIWLDKAK